MKSYLQEQKQLNTYLERFFEEKEIPFTSWELEDNKNRSHIINSEVVIEYIHDSLDNEHKRKVVSKLRQLDFHNQPIIPFLKYLATWIVTQYSSYSYE